MYLRLLSQSSDRFGLRIWAYCLMTNHVHLIVVPDYHDSIWRTFHRTDGLYSRLFNEANGFVGHLWQERPFSCVLSESHLWNAVRYVERNPVRAGMVERAQDYPWSSARAHCLAKVDPMLDPDCPLHLELQNWSSWLNAQEDPEFEALVRDRTRTGRPCGDDEFIHTIEGLTGRDFAIRKRGRQPKVIR